VATATPAPLRFDDRLRDRFYGEWAGYSLEHVKARFGSIDSAPFVESWSLLQERTEEAFLEATAAVEPGRTARGAAAAAVAFVAHDAVLRALLGGLLPALSPARLYLPTGSWSELTPVTSGHHWRVVHLGELPQSGRRPAL
jgi:broad specificity phosphatase PhoE